jgi:hypothetical protein
MICPAQSMGEPDDVSRRQNLRAIKHISADHSSSVDEVLSTMRDCETITLTVEQMNMANDIVDSVHEHDTERGVTAYYLIRYGMKLAQRHREDRTNPTETADEQKESAASAANTDGGGVEPE